MIAVRKLALQKNLFEITQGRAHARHPLAEFHEALLDELLAETRPEQPRRQVPHVPSVERDLLNVVPPEHLTQMIRDKLIGDGLARRRLQVPLRAPEVVGDPICGRFIGQPFGRGSAPLNRADYWVCCALVGRRDVRVAGKRQG